MYIDKSLNKFEIKWRLVAQYMPSMARLLAEVEFLFGKCFYTGEVREDLRLNNLKEIVSFEKLSREIYFKYKLNYIRGTLLNFDFLCWTETWLCHWFIILLARKIFFHSYVKCTPTIEAETKLVVLIIFSIHLYAVCGFLLNIYGKSFPGYR